MKITIFARYFITLTALVISTVISCAAMNSATKLAQAKASLQKGDYRVAENEFRRFLNDHPEDNRANEATFGLAESLFQQRNYTEAARYFLQIFTKYPGSSGITESLYRLGNSMAALNSKAAACAAYRKATESTKTSAYPVHLREEGFKPIFKIMMRKPTQRNGPQFELQEMRKEIEAEKLNIGC